MKMKLAESPWRPTAASEKRVYPPRVGELFQPCENAGINNSTCFKLLKKDSHFACERRYRGEAGNSITRKPKTKKCKIFIGADSEPAVVSGFFHVERWWKMQLLSKSSREDENPLNSENPRRKKHKAQSTYQHLKEPGRQWHPIALFLIWVAQVRSHERGRVEIPARRILLLFLLFFLLLFLFHD